MNERSATLVVIEDETAVRRSIIGKIRRENLPLTIQGEYQNAEEAYEGMKVNVPEIVLLDMRMPGMGGMKFLEILNHEYPSIQVIVLSGFSEFDFLKKAITCGAKDYLLKPVVREELRSALEKAIAETRKLKKQRYEGEKVQLFLEKNMSVIKAQLLHQLVYEGKMNSVEYEHLLEQRKEELPYHSYLLIKGRIKKTYQLKKGETESDRFMKVFGKAEKLLCSVFNRTAVLSNIGSPYMPEEFMCVFGFRKGEKFSETDCLKSKLKNGIYTLKETEGAILHLTVSNFYEEILDTRNQHLESLCANLIKDDNSTVYFSERDQEHTPTKFLTKNKAELLLEYVKENNRKSIVLTVNELFQTIERKPEKLVSSQKLALEILDYIEKSTMPAEPVKVNSFNSSSVQIGVFYDSIRLFTDVENVKYQVIAALSNKAEKNAKEQNKQNNSIIPLAKKLIDENFHEEITLEYVANKLPANKSYLSELFKEEVGLTFNKYLNWVRIEKAKELLVVHDLNATQIAELVGYKDHVYFSIVFKKFTGYPPGKYKQKIKNENPITSQEVRAKKEENVSSY